MVVNTRMALDMQLIAMCYVLIATCVTHCYLYSDDGDSEEEIATETTETIPRCHKRYRLYDSFGVSLTKMVASYKLLPVLCPVNNYTRCLTYPYHHTHYATPSKGRVYRDKKI